VKAKFSEQTRERNMGRAIDKACRGSAVPLRALWCKARSGGGHLRQATAREEKVKEKKQEKIYT